MKQRFTKRTRLVSALLTLAMVFTFLPFSAFAATGDIAINDTSVFPDAGFREYLLNGYHYVDGTKTRIDDGDGILSQDERMAVKNMDVRGYAVYGLKGIEHFPELRELNCTNRPIGSLDLSQNTKLEILYCKNNGLTQLNLSKNPNITVLDCSNNNLGNLNLSNNTKLENLNCSYDELNELDVKKNTELRELICIGNHLKELDVDVAHKKKLATLKCSDNQLESLIVGENRLLNDLRCDINQLSQLDLNNLERLETLYCSDNKLTILNVSYSPALNDLRYMNNQLTSLNLEQSPLLSQSNTSAWFNNNVYTVTLNPDRTFNLSTLSGGAFDVSKASGWNGGTVNGNILTVNKDVNKVTYSYRCSDNVTSVFALDVTGTGGIPGGGSTGGGSTGGGSTGGGSTGGGTISPEAGKYQLTVTDGVATVNGSKGAVLNVTPGDKVTLTADTTKFPEDDEFGWWEISPYGSVSDTLTGQYQRTATFMMPNENVTARAMSKTAGVSTGGDGGGGGAAILLVGGAAAAGLVGYGVYSYVSEQQLKALLPEGVAMPENRAQTALLLWNTAGRPEPAAQPAFPDVADPDTAKAAQWCVEHGLMNAKFRGRFAPDGSSPAYKTLNAYRQLVG